ncbi:MAG: TetR/AcrR family transcriptional regulator [Acidimicrobiales bacterium]
MRAHIAGCALELFRSDGYAGVSMRRLAGSAGCTPMTLYKYFENKFEILQLIWADVFVELFDALDAVVAVETDPVARLDALAEGYVDFWLEHRDHYFLVFMSSGITQDDVSLFMGDASVISRFDLFARAVAEVLGVDADPDLLRVRSEVLICGLNGVAQALVTMSGYPWADTSSLVRGVTAGATAP